MPNDAERKIYYILRQILGDTTIIIDGFYSWLPSPKGFPMQLDFFIPKHKLAIEFQGPQHYKRDPKYQTKADFKYYNQCDKLKKKTCQKQNIRFMTIKYTERFDAEALTKRFKSRGIL